MVTGQCMVKGVEYASRLPLPLPLSLPLPLPLPLPEPPLRELTLPTTSPHLTPPHPTKPHLTSRLSGHTICGDWYLCKLVVPTIRTQRYARGRVRVRARARDYDRDRDRDRVSGGTSD